MTKTFEADLTKDKTFRVLCSACKNTTKHKVLTSISEEGAEPWDHNYTFEWNTDYEIIQCQGCETISFRLYSINSEEDDPYDGSPIPTVHLYPRRSKETLPVNSYLNVPFNLQRIYTETINSYNYDNLTLCGAGVRALVEGLCKENGITGGLVEVTKASGTVEERKTDLQGKINGLYQSGKMTKQNAEILHEHRFLGNVAIHELSQPSKEDLSLAIEIVENVFDTMYEIPSKGMKLKSKRLKR